MRVLVTGGAGYIGSHTCKALARAGHEPVVLDNLCMGKAANVRWGPFVEGSLADRQSISDAIRTYGVEAVIHFAADACSTESVTNPGKYFRNNVVNSVNLFDVLIETGVDRIVFSSSCAIYGNPTRVPVSEDYPHAPISPYGESKSMVERALRWYGEAHGVKWAVLRYFNAAGADPDGELGEEHEPEFHIIPLVIQTALNLRSHFHIFGTDYPTPDGTAIRDYIHVTDLAEAHSKTLQYLNDGGGPTTLNLGTGVGNSVNEVIEVVTRVGGKAVNVVNSPRRFGDPAVIVADASRSAKVLGWRPRYSGLETIVETAWRWHSRHGHPSTDSPYRVAK